MGRLNWLVFTSPDKPYLHAAYTFEMRNIKENDMYSSGAARIVRSQFGFHFLLPLAFRQLSVGSDKISNPLVFPFWEIRHFLKKKKLIHLSPETV